MPPWALARSWSSVPHVVIIASKYLTDVARAPLSPVATMSAGNDRKLNDDSSLSISPTIFMPSTMCWAENPPTLSMESMSSLTVMPFLSSMSLTCLFSSSLLLIAAIKTPRDGLRICLWLG